MEVKEEEELNDLRLIICRIRIRRVSHPSHSLSVTLVRAQH